MLTGMINGWNNAALNSARLSLEADIGRRTTFLIGGLWSNVKLIGNDYILKPLGALKGLVFGADLKEPAPVPEIPASLKDDALADDLTKSYKQRCDAVIASAKSATCLVNLDLNGYTAEKAKRRHSNAMKDVVLPEDRRAENAASAGEAGGLVANIPAALKNRLADAIRTT